MIRAILAVVFGYVCMFLIVALGLTAAYALMGADRAFETGTYEITTAWAAVWGLTSLVAAVAGGFICGRIARGPRPVMALVLLVLILGGISAAMAAAAPEPPPEQLVRAGDVDNTQAMMRARSPMWIQIMNPIVGAGGVLVGALLAGVATPRNPE